ESTDRIAGDIRYDTAIETSKTGWAKSDTVILARGDNYADALAGVPLAHKLDGPILLTPPDKLWEATKEEIARLGANNVIILGGEDAVGANIEKSLVDDDYNVRRMEGHDRFETATLIANEVAPKGSTDAIIANGMDFPDAVSVASSAAKDGIPILLAKDDWISGVTMDRLKKLGAEKTYVIGGPKVVSDTITNKLPDPKRLAGDDRY